MRPRMWALLALAALLVIVVAMPGGDPDPADSAAVARGGPDIVSTPEPTPEEAEPTSTPDPAKAARAEASRLTKRGRHADAAAVLAAAGLKQAAARAERRASRALLRSARAALAKGRYARAKRLAVRSRRLHRSGGARAVIADAEAALAAERERRRRERDARTCSSAERRLVRSGAATPPGCEDYAAELAVPEQPDCHPSYEGACLKPDSPDYDCAGGSGNGPDYTGPVRVVGPDEYDLDRDGDGQACEA